MKRGKNTYVNDNSHSIRDLAITFFVEAQLDRGQIRRQCYDAFLYLCMRVREPRRQLPRVHRRRKSVRRVRVVLSTTETVDSFHVRIREELVENVRPKRARGTRQDDLTKE